MKKLFSVVPKDSYSQNQIVSALNILFPSLLYLMLTPDSDFNTILDTLWAKIPLT